MTSELYRQTKLGDSLVSALEDLLDSQKITPDLAIKVLSEFDKVPQNRDTDLLCLFALVCRSFAHVSKHTNLNVLQSYLEAIKTNFKARATFTGGRAWFRSVDNVWTFVVPDAKFKINYFELSTVQAQGQQQMPQKYQLTKCR